MNNQLRVQAESEWMRKRSTEELLDLAEMEIATPWDHVVVKLAEQELRERQADES